MNSKTDVKWNEVPSLKQTTQKDTQNVMSAAGAAGTRDACIVVASASLGNVVAKFFALLVVMVTWA